VPLGDIDVGVSVAEHQAVFSRLHENWENVQLLGVLEIFWVEVEDGRVLVFEVVLHYLTPGGQKASPIPFDPS